VCSSASSSLRSHIAPFQIGTQFLIQITPRRRVMGKLIIAPSTKKILDLEPKVLERVHNNSPLHPALVPRSITIQMRPYSHHMYWKEMIYIRNTATRYHEFRTNYTCPSGLRFLSQGWAKLVNPATWEKRSVGAQRCSLLFQAQYSLSSVS